MKDRLFMQQVELIKEYLFSFAFRTLLDEDDAKDALQETFYRLWKTRKKIRDPQNIKSYAFRILSNYCFDQLHKKKRYPKMDEKTMEIYGPTEELDTMIESKEILEQLQTDIDNLPEMQRIIVNLKDIQGFSTREISEMLGLNMNAVRVNLSRGRSKVLVKKEIEYLS